MKTVKVNMCQVFIGQIVHTNSLDDFEIFPNGFVAVDINGKIIGIGNNYEKWSLLNTLYEKQECHLTSNQFLMPGFVDCHIHAPQVPQIGLGLNLPLLQWLNAYTFPVEAKFHDTEYAQRVYSKVVETTIKCGTTLASYFGTNHKESTLVLAKEAIKQGQRALVGKVCSDCNSPDFYIESLDESIQATYDFLHSFQELKSDLVKPTITPRFAVSCTKELLKSLGDIAREKDLHVQSHISESIAEIEFIKKIFSMQYANVYDISGLLTHKTILAHAVHLEDEEIDLMCSRNTSVAHCPGSNTMLNSGLCDVVRLLKKGIKVGLGTDVSGGNSISIQNTILRALEVSRHITFMKKQIIKGTESVTLKFNASKEDYTPISYKQAIYLSTLGGAEALALDKITGNFVLGKDFDALLIDAKKFPLHNYEFYNEISKAKSPETKLLELVQTFIYVGDDRNIVKVFISGKEVKTL